MTILKLQPAHGLFVLVIVLLLVLDRCDYEHDYEQEHEGFFGLPASGGFQPGAAVGELRAKSVFARAWSLHAQHRQGDQAHRTEQAGVDGIEVLP